MNTEGHALMHLWQAFHTHCIEDDYREAVAQAPQVVYSNVSSHTCICCGDHTVTGAAILTLAMWDQFNVNGPRWRGMLSALDCNCMGCMASSIASTKMPRM